MYINVHVHVQLYMYVYVRQNTSGVVVWTVLCCAQLRMAVAEALGFMVHLLSPTALNDQLPKLLPGIMQLYRKHSEHYYISQVHRNEGSVCFRRTCTCSTLSGVWGGMGSNLTQGGK